MLCSSTPLCHASKSNFELTFDLDRVSGAWLRCFTYKRLLSGSPCSTQENSSLKRSCVDGGEQFGESAFGAQGTGAVTDVLF